MLDEQLLKARAARLALHCQWVERRLTKRSPARWPEFVPLGTFRRVMAEEIRILTDEEFAALSVPEKVEYLRKATAARDTVNRQLNRMIDEYIPTRVRDGKPTP